jgi:hypothetical protein
VEIVVKVEIPFTNTSIVSRDKTDTYKYTVLNKGQVESQMLSTEVDFEDEN